MPSSSQPKPEIDIKNSVGNKEVSFNVKKIQTGVNRKIDKVEDKLDKKIEQKIYSVENKIIQDRERMHELDKKIWQLQRSTRTLFKSFAKLHNVLRAKYKFYYNWHLNPYSDLTHWIVLIIAFLLSIYLLGFQFGFFGGHKPASMAAAGIPKMINYQGKLTDANNVPVADAAYNMILTIYDASVAGNALWSARESDACGAVISPSAKSIATVNGLFSTLLGETGDCALNLDFNTDTYWLGVTVGADAEMTPRKRIGAVGYAYNSDTVDGIHASSTATANYLLPLDASTTFSLPNTSKVQFFDVGIYIQSPADGKLLLSSDGALVDAIALTTGGTGGIDINAGTAGVTIDQVGGAGTGISFDAANASNFTTSAGDLTIQATAASVLITGGEAVADAVNIDATTAGGGITLDVADTGVIAIGTAAVDQDINIGNVTANSNISVSSGGTGDITLNSDDTVLIDADGVLELNSSAGVISIGNDADAQNINIGTGAAARVITIGNTTANTSLTLTATASIDITNSNIIYVPIGGDIEAYVTAATAGDTLILAAGTYTVIDDIDIGKIVSIIGQGVGITTISCATGSKNVFDLSTGGAGTRISDLTINNTGGTGMDIRTSGGTTVSVFENLNVLASGAGVNYGININNTNATLRDITMTITSSDNQALGLYFNQSTDTVFTINAYNVHSNTDGSATGSRPFVVNNGNVASVVTLNLYDCVGIAAAAGTIDYGLSVTSTTTMNAVANTYNCTFNGQDADVSNAGTNVLTLYDTTLVNGTTSGTIAYDGKVVTEDLYAENSLGVGVAAPSARLEVETTSTSGVTGLLVDQKDLDQIAMQLTSDTNATAVLFDMASKNISGNVTNLSWDNAGVQADGNIAGFYLDFTKLTPTNNGANYVYGMQINDPAANNSAVAYGLYVQGTNWDYALYTEMSSYLAGTLTVANYNSAVGTVKFLELAANGTNYITFKAPDSLTVDKTYILPSVDGSSGNALTTDGAGNLSWGSSATNMQLGTFSNLVINQDPTNNLIQINITADSVVAWNSSASLSYEARSITKSAQLRSQTYTNDPVAGDNIVLNVASTLALSANNYVRVSSSAGTEQAMIVSIVANTSITVDHLSLDHTTTNRMITKVWGSDAGGLDTGLEAASTWYYVWLMALPSTSTYGIFLSTSATAPTAFQGTWTYKRLLGVVYNNASSDIFPFNQKNDEYLWAAPNKVGDNVGSTTTASQSLSAAVPPNIAKGVFGKVMTNGPGFWCYGPKTFSNALPVDNNVAPFSVHFSAVTTSNIWDLPVLVESQIMYHQGSAASVDIWVSGFRFNF